MHVVTQKRIWEAKARWPRAANALDAWYRLVKAAEPRDFADLKALFPATDKVGSHPVCDIGGNKIRLIAIVNFRYQKIFIIDILDHDAYDRGAWKELCDECLRSRRRRALDPCCVAA